MKKILITTPIYYANDKAHVGHAYTTLAADVLSRFFRIQKKDVFFLTGTDEHGTKIARSAEQQGVSPQDLCDKNSELFKRTWKNLNIKYDHFIRTTDEIHQKTVKQFLKKLKHKEVIYEKEYQGLYCSECEKFLTENELENGVCPDHKIKPEKISEKNYFFKLTDYLKQVKSLIENDKLKINPSQAKKETLGLLKQGLDDFSISRKKERVKWGIELPFDNNQTIYVWIDALLNYITGNGSKKFDSYWQDGQVIHLLAKDILKFHAIYWPAMLLATNHKLPHQEFIHGFFTINGQKMSKTLKNVIDPNKMIERFGTDAVRYLLLSQFPFGQDGDTKEQFFEEKYNSDLANGLGNLTSRILNIAAKNEISYNSMYKPAKNIQNKVKETKNSYKQKMEELKLYKALKEIWDLISFCDSYIEKNKPWQIEDDKKIKQILSDLLYCLSEISKLIEPFLPETSGKIKQQLDSGKSEALFPRI